MHSEDEVLLRPDVFEDYFRFSKNKENESILIEI